MLQCKHARRYPKTPCGYTWPSVARSSHMVLSMMTSATQTTTTMTYETAYAELNRTMTRRQVEILIKWVMSRALEGCVHNWIADEAKARFGVRPELVRGLLSV
jgi:hypothetical protein